VDTNSELPGSDSTMRTGIYFQGSLLEYKPRTALQAAVGVGNTELVDLLLSHGADARAPAFLDNGATALQLAAMKGLLGVARKLLESGASCNEDAPGPWGRTALEGAAEQGRLDMVQLLLSHGVETTGPSRGLFVNAVKLATQNAHYAVTDLLRNSRAWEQADEQLFCRDQQGPPTAPTSSSAPHCSVTSQGNWKGKEKETIWTADFPATEVSQELLGHKSPWAAYEVLDESNNFWHDMGLMMDWSSGVEDNSSSSGPSTSDCLRAADGGSQPTGNLNLEGGGFYPGVETNGLDLKDEDWFTAFLHMQDSEEPYDLTFLWDDTQKGVGF